MRSSLPFLVAAVSLVDSINFRGTGDPNDPGYLGPRIRRQDMCDNGRGPYCCDGARYRNEPDILTFIRVSGCEFLLFVEDIEYCKQTNGQIWCCNEAVPFDTLGTHDDCEPYTLNPSFVEPNQETTPNPNGNTPNTNDNTPNPNGNTLNHNGNQPPAPNPGQQLQLPTWDDIDGTLNNIKGAAAGAAEGGANSLFINLGN